MRTRLIAAAIVLAALASCGRSRQFSVEAELPALGTQEITVVYTTANGDRAVMRIPALDGRFSFTGNNDGYSRVELFKANKTLLAAFDITNGESAKLVAEGDSMVLQGLDRPQGVITSIADSVADRWPEFVSPELIVAPDSVFTFEPYGKWVFTASMQERDAALRDSLKIWAKGKKPVRDVYMSGDMSQWRINTRRDSATWTQGLLPDGPLKLKGIVNFTPCIVEVDSASKVISVHRFE